MLLLPLVGLVFVKSAALVLTQPSSTGVQLLVPGSPVAPAAVKETSLNVNGELFNGRPSFPEKFFNVEGQNRRTVGDVEDFEHGKKCAK